MGNSKKVKKHAIVSSLILTILTLLGFALLVLFMVKAPHIFFLGGLGVLVIAMTFNIFYDTNVKHYEKKFRLEDKEQE
jgi:small neutral amino acid transporter SnatA (MarC family)